MENIITSILIGIVVLAVAIGLIGKISNEMNEISAGFIIDRCVNTGIGGTACYLTIEGSLNGKTVNYRFEVTEEEYCRYKIGDYYER